MSLTYTLRKLIPLTCTRDICHIAQIDVPESSHTSLDITGTSSRPSNDPPSSAPDASQFIPAKRRSFPWGKKKKKKQKWLICSERHESKGLTMLEALFVQSIPTAFAEHKWSLGYSMHSIVTNGTVVVRTWNTSVLVLTPSIFFSRGSRWNFASCTSVCLADVRMGNWVRCKWGLSKYRFEFATK